MTAILSVGCDQMAKRTIILQRAGYLATEVYSRREALRQLRSIRSFRNWVRRLIEAIAKHCFRDVPRGRAVQFTVTGKSMDECALSPATPL
jgi:hypothetical protein